MTTNSRTHLRTLASAALAISLSACGGSDDACAPRQPTPIDPAITGTLTGVIRYHGKLPERREIEMSGAGECSGAHPDAVLDDSLLVVADRLANAVVHLSGGAIEGMTFAFPTEPLVLDQQGCLFAPHVAVARVCQPVRYLNSDKVLHNVHAVTKQNSTFNFALSTVGQEKTRPFTVEEVALYLKCDVHPWMKSWVAVLDHPFFAVTNATGTFEIRGIPAGEYQLTVWHEVLGTQTQTVTIPAKLIATVAVEMPSAPN